MTLPAGNSQTFSILLEFQTNEALFNEIEKKTQNITDSVERAKEMQRLYAEEIKKTYPELYKQIEAEKKAAEALEKSKEAAKKNTAQIRAMRAEARLYINEARLLTDQAEDLDRVFRPLAAGGALITGGIFALANKYVKEATEATQVTEEWKAAQAALAQSGKEIGAVLAQEALPLMKEAAQIAGSLADIIEKNPEIVKATLYGGMLALAVGTIGKLYTSGLRLYADAKLDKAMLLQMSAAELQLKASENQLAAAGMQSKSGVVSSASVSKPTLGQVALVASSVLIGAELGVALGNKIGQMITGGKTGLAGQGNFGIGDAAVSGLMAFQTPSFLAVKGLNALGVVSDDTVKKMKETLTGLDKFAASLLGADKILNVLNNLSPTSQQISQAPSFLGGSRETQDQAVKVFSEWRRDDARIMKAATEERKQIISDGEKAVLDITKNYISSTASIARQYSTEASKITQNFLEANKKAEQDFIIQRSEIEQDGEERIREIRADAQEKREKAERDFQKASAQAAADRDALALVRAQEAREEALSEANKGASEAIQKERQETQQRLAELSARFVQERAQRQAEYEQDLKENSIRRAAAMKEAQERYQQELKQQREAQAQKLKELADAEQRERIQRRESAISQLQDLGLVLNNERQLRNNAYNAMLYDLQSWLNSMNASFGNTTSASSLGATASGGTAASINPNSNFSGSNMYGTHDYSGYAYPGIYRMAANGRPEWVMSGNDTRAAEQAIGGQLTQNGVARMIQLMAALRGSKSVIDNSVYGKDMTTRQIRDIKEETSMRLEKMLGGY